ncbi:hypothetical protein KR51_00001890 [Rubidibacter lacunae KORDI 51-2]|uniref:Uncharacterized protein n=1 Tax=Rubidibacter lacunae KORDI 51-2 TaxID=582515 RepID=U5DQJ3_9CHRO|nr:hypothetical protein [Rubidibacter lacunae]ERN42894.1 hypothetical protein KR51_00001890 [Rubidibacter lacunae KORDI 51-2]
MDRQQASPGAVALAIALLMLITGIVFGGASYLNRNGDRAIGGYRSTCRARIGRGYECIGWVEVLNHAVKLQIGARSRTKARSYPVNVRVSVESGRVRVRFRTYNGRVVRAIATPSRPAVLRGQARFTNDRMRLLLVPVDDEVRGLSYAAVIRPRRFRSSN